MAAAQVREACTIPGTSVRTAWLCRDKPSMKEALRAAGVPSAASTAATSAGRGARLRADSRLPADPQAAHRRGRARHRRGSTTRGSSTRRWAASAARAWSRSPSRSSSRGTRASTTPLTIDGHAALDFVSHYYPNVLEAMRTRWISPQFVSTNRIDSAGDYQELRELGAQGHRRARHRHLRHAHGVVLRAEGAAVLRDRLPATRRRRVGPLLGGQRPRPLPRVGEGDRARRTSARGRRGSSPPASSRCGPTATATSPATPASTRCRPAWASG